MKRVLHVMHHMARGGGAESWLMHVLRNVDRDEYRMDVVVQTEAKGTFDDEIRALGSGLFKCLGARRPWVFAANFRAILAEHGPYDIVHSHIHDYSGFVLLLARCTGVRRLIAHSHIDWSPVRKEAKVPRKLYAAVTRWLIRRYATAGFGCSAPAAADLFGPGWAHDGRWEILHCGIDLTPFREIGLSMAGGASELRRSLGIDDDDFVIGNVGRFVHQKNHDFLVKLAGECVRREARTKVLLVGHGGLRPDIERAVAQSGLTDRVIFAGVRADVTRLMVQAIDVFVLPSFYEGLPVALIEAQAAGLPCVISDAIASEAAAVGPLVQRVSLKAPVERWADAVLSVRSKPPSVTRGMALELMAESSFNIRNCVDRLREVYGRP
jgi:glycosyltransferase involved in cell wall biosynthesis